MPRPVVLASGSAIRAQLLREAGVAFDVVPARVDEGAVKEAMLAEGAPHRDVADALAEAKAVKVSQSRPDALVIGADQVLTDGGRLFDKPTSVSGAADHIRTLRGRPHKLVSAAVIAEAGRPVWRQVSEVVLTMRPLSDAFVARYVAAHGDALTETVGAYKLEAGGAQLFSRIDGDYFSVLGLPLLDVLEALRRFGVLDE